MCVQQAATLRHRSASIRINRITRVRITPTPIPEKLDKLVELLELFIYLIKKSQHPAKCFFDLSSGS